MITCIMFTKIFKVNTFNTSLKNVIHKLNTLITLSITFLCDFISLVSYLQE